MALGYEVDGAVAYLTLDDPDRRNVITQELMDELEEAVGRADRDDAVRVVVIKANGRSFGAGYDVGPWPSAGMDGDAPAFDVTKPDWSFLHKKLYGSRRNGAWWLELLWDLRKPTIAQVHGACLAGSNDLALCCDLVYAADDARFGLPQARAQGITHVFPHFPLQLGIRRAKELAFTGDAISGREAAALGLINAAVPVEELDGHVRRIAERVALAPPEMLMSNKFACNRVYETMGFDAMVRNANEYNATGGFNSMSAEFARIAFEEGVKAAIAFRDGPWAEQ